MRAPPLDLTAAEVANAVAEGWRLRTSTIDYVPEGGGSHHWRLVTGDAESYFVTVDDLDDKAWIGDSREVVLEGLTRALRTSEVLRDRAGLDFVLAPVATGEGDVLQRVTDRYTVTLFPFLAGHSGPFGLYTDPRLRVRALDMVIALHRSTAHVTEMAPRHDLFAGHAELQSFVDHPDARWDSGPFAEPAFALIEARRHELTTLVAGFDRRVESTAIARAATVITHGEPHPGNLLSVDDRVFLIDWDTAALAPPERDLWLIVAGDSDVARYERATGRRVDRSMLLLYELRWYVDDLASAIHLFRNAHEHNADTQRWFEGLSPRLALLPEWLERIS